MVEFDRIGASRNHTNMADPKRSHESLGPEDGEGPDAKKVKLYVRGDASKNFNSWRWFDRVIALP
jgi:hypothetical protein